MTTPERVVFDCNVFFQALTSPRGPAGSLLGHASSGDISLLISAHTLDELAAVAARPHIVQKYGLDAAVVTAVYCQHLFVFDVPRFSSPRF
jgi:uncharacterized protein